MFIKTKRKKEREALGEPCRNILPGAAAGAFLVSAVLFLILLGVEKNMLSNYEKGMIFTASEKIPQGQLLTEENCGRYLEQRAIDRTLISDTALTEAGQVLGLLAKTDIAPGTMLATGMFEEMQDIRNELHEPVVAGVKAEDLYQVAGGTLRAGDRIHIYTVKEETGQAVLIWENIFVQQVFDSAGNTIENGDTATAAQRINVLLDAGDVERFYTALEEGALRTVKVWR